MGYSIDFLTLHNHFITSFPVKLSSGHQKLIMRINISSMRFLRFDEVSLKIDEHRPDAAILTESWLCPDIPDSSLAINGYSICRKDRSRNGGGIITYIAESYSYRVLSDSDIPSLRQCDTEFLPILFLSVPIIIICLYHPFWNDSLRDKECILVSVIGWILP